jgi:hypothetical protein
MMGLAFSYRHVHFQAFLMVGRVYDWASYDL